ncbi:MAG: asparagine synthase (glutamine-hydrolyzing) [Spirochaetales bacterium]|nr:asparagine synthase (glutamine-hydrolyzing) [Spirochaetales bacterium]
MCGIVGFRDPRGTAPERLSSLVDRMNATLVHRGPDGDGLWVDEKTGTALGHRRLSIIDLSPAGRQPMTSFCGRYTAVYNGEIYNFRELRSELEGRGVPPWRGHSDTEVMLAGFSVWGIEATLPRLNGMFACAVFDAEDGGLCLIRDRMGKKPLYYGYQGGAFLFGSELKALAAHPAFEGDIDRDVLAQYLRYNYVPGPYSIYRGIFKLPPASFLRLTTDASVRGALPRPALYWDQEEIFRKGTIAPLAAPENRLIDDLDVLLRDAVKRRMIADVPLGVFLSGGIDSSLVTALMQAQSGAPVRSFSIGFSEKAFDEALFAKTVAERLGTEHTELYVTPQDALDVIPGLPHMFDEPFADSSQIPTHLVARLSRRHVTVALSGDGGDEIFGGYTRYLMCDRAWRSLKRVPCGIRSAVCAALRSLPAGFYDNPFMNRRHGAQSTVGDRIIKLLDAADARDPLTFYENLFLTHWRRPEKFVRKSRPLADLRTPESLIAFPGHLIEKLMFLDSRAYLPDDILVKTDRTSMAVALETRSPLLDYRIYEFAARLPLSVKTGNGEGKWILRELLGRYLPRGLFERPKKGFSVPLAAWLRGPLKEWAEALLNSSRLIREGFFNPAPVNAIWRAHLSGHRNHSHRLWNVLMFQAWLEAPKAA